MKGSGIVCREVGYARSGANTILHSVNGGFPRGVISLITGPTGSGKTTLLHLLCGLLRPTEGTVEADGERISRWVSGYRERWRRNTGIIFQELYTIDTTVEDNMIVALLPLLGGMKEIRRRIGESLDVLGIAHLRDRRVRMLSRGERQKVCIARALSRRPGFLFADEPTAHQDDSGSILLLQLLKDAGSNGAAVIIASHDVRVNTSPAIDCRWDLSGGGRLTRVR